MKIDLLSPVSSANFGGVERYATNLLREFARAVTQHSFRLVNFPSSIGGEFLFEHIEVHPQFRDVFPNLFRRGGVRFALRSGQYLTSLGFRADLLTRTSGYLRQMGISAALDSNGNHRIIHGLSHFVPRFVDSAHLVVTVHDIGPLRYPRLYPASYTQYMRYDFAQQLARCDRIIVDSPFTSGEVVKYYGIQSNRLVVVPLGVEEGFKRTDPTPVLKRHGLFGKYVFYPVGTIEPRKNLREVVDACRMVRRKTNEEYTLLITGRRLANYPDVERDLKDATREGILRDLGFVPSSDLPALYSGAEFTLYPSIYEGFGLPVLESMACGTPVIISPASALRFVGGDAVLCLDGFSAAEIAEGMLALHSDSALRETCADRGLHRASTFRWTDTARKTIAVYDSLE